MVLNKSPSPDPISINTKPELNDQIQISKEEFPVLETILIDSDNMEESDDNECKEENKSRITHSECTNSIK